MPFVFGIADSLWNYFMRIAVLLSRFKQQIEINAQHLKSRLKTDNSNFSICYNMNTDTNCRTQKETIYLNVKISI